MDPIVALFIAVIALLMGAAFGWFFATKSVAVTVRAAEDTTASLRSMLDGVNQEHQLTKSELETIRSQRDAVNIRLAGAEERAQLTTKLEARALEAESKLNLAQSQVAAMNSSFEERELSFEREMKRILDTEEKLQSKFADISGKILDDARNKFLESADQKLREVNKTGAFEIEKIVGPVGKSLKAYEERVDKIEKDRTEAYGSLKGLMDKMDRGQESVRAEANRLMTTLRGASKARGDWGELQFENLLESCGLRDKTDFKTQESFNSPGGALRPDAIINIPGGKKLIVDIKNVFNSYVSANEAEEEEQRRAFLKDHARNIKKQIEDLAAKRYQDHVRGSADFVVMFIPGEHVLYAALSEDSSLLEFALSKNIVLSSPLNFMSIALTIATIWRHEGMHEDAVKVAELGKQLYERLGRVSSRLQIVGSRLESTTKAFNDLVTGFEGQQGIMNVGREFEKLSIDTTGKTLESANSVQLLPSNVQSAAKIISKD